ncbi:MAG: hypothetical protein KJO49_10705 [Bacteroidia bacterium]|nr:hypothetical protein [Bacteroidia bacterium]MBT8270397.1 hypothetical protein [Bacteroidia bacterium]NNF82586.1 hypothetical protein [Flavobacteriaceae bacterium]NNK68848.1 hypothetical protein [Flavobacteriaceae bacterium]NNL79884.1 hypothetical protein [Flavobacteriaceae bacterium]
MNDYLRIRFALKINRPDVDAVKLLNKLLVFDEIVDLEVNELKYVTLRMTNKVSMKSLNSAIMPDAELSDEIDMGSLFKFFP